MTPEDFIAKWRGVELSERAASQDHFNELCALLEIQKPTDADPTGAHFTFEKQVPKAGKGGGSGYADVWRKNCFVWEYKRKDTYRTLAAALAQARDYASWLEQPPLAIACDINEIQIRTLFTGSVSVTHTIRLADLNDAANRQLLRRCFTDPDSLKPQITAQAVTEEAARKFATLAQTLRDRNDRIGQKHDPRRVAHFLNRIVFCLFAEDSGLLPGNVFSAIVEEALRDRSALADMLADLFDKMRTGKGRFGTVAIPHFNGGLFDDDDVLDLNFPEVQILGEATKLDWKSIEPIIFGTLFERGLDPAKRKEMAGLFDAAPPPIKASRKKKALPATSAALPLRGGATAAQRSLGKGVGIHYTDTATIMKIVEPVVLRPLREEWETVKAAIAKAKGTKKKDDLYLAFRDRLGAFRVLDPACGSGNFLYLALRHLKDFDKLVESDGKALGATADPQGQRITPKTVLGIEINPYAAELARVTVWIGELQWQMANSYGITRRPILGKLDNIENRDALLTPNGKIALWPKAAVVIGNPPFLGTKRMIRALGEEYVENLRSRYEDQVSRFSDLVCFWFEKARAMIDLNEAERAGFVSTNSIRGGKNRLTLDRIVSSGRIFDAWSDEPWIVDGAAVRVSLVSFDGHKNAAPQKLNGKDVDQINADLTVGGGANLTLAKVLDENRNTGFIGTQKTGSFDIPGVLARQMLLQPSNPNGRPNSDVVRPWFNGEDITQRPTDTWVIDFGTTMNETESSHYEQPFEYVVRNIKPGRIKVRRENHAKNWWRHAEARPGMRRALSLLTRYIATPRVSKYRLFVWKSLTALTDSAAVAIARDDDTSFGILHSIVHELWALGLGTWLGVGNDPRYTPSTTFETFPFPDGLTPNIVADRYASDPRAVRIAEAAVRLLQLREAWLNPPELVKREPEVTTGYPDRILPKGLAEAEQLAKRTLTALYNTRPTWLANAHRDLDRAVLAAYGLPEQLAARAAPENADASDRNAAADEILRLLLNLNQQRASAQQ